MSLLRAILPLTYSLADYDPILDRAATTPARWTPGEREPLLHDSEPPETYPSGL